MFHIRRSDHCRPGFTLMELLVVVFIMMVLVSLTLGVIFMPERERSARGASMLQGWLLNAKTRAVRDRVPTGVRLKVDPTNPTWVTELVYIQQPEYLGGGSMPGGAGPRMTSAVTQNGKGIVTFQNVDFSQSVQPGDYLEIKGGGPVHYIESVQANTLIVASPVTRATEPFVGPTTQFRIIRRPRLLVGEPPMRLPQEVIIDLAPTCSQNLPIDGDILFSPSGEVLSQVLSPDQVILWVRDTEETNVADWPTNRRKLYRGQHLLVAIKVRTGMVAVHPINFTGDPFLFTKEALGRSSGM